jgi:hypothetical protein
MIKIFRNVFPSHGGDRKTFEEQPFIKEIMIGITNSGISHRIFSVTYRISNSNKTTDATSGTGTYPSGVNSLLAGFVSLSFLCSVLLTIVCFILYLLAIALCDLPIIASDYDIGFF